MAASGARLSRGQLVKAMVLAGAAGLLTLLLESAATLIKGWSFSYAWALAALLAVGGGIVSMFISLATDRALTPETTGGEAPQGTVYGRAQVPGPGHPLPPYGRTGGPPVPPRRRVPVFAGVLVLLVLCGAGGAGIAAGVQRGVAFVRTRIDPVSEEGEERLVKAVTKQAGPLTITVSGVEVTSRITKVRVTAANSGDETILLPRGFTQFAVRGRATLSNRPLDSDFPDEVAAGGEIGGLLVFDGVPPPGPVTASLTFPHVGGFNAPKSVTVSDLRLAGSPPAGS
jgi:hypothetical protein